MDKIRLRKLFIFLSGLILVFLAFEIIYADSNGVWNRAEDIRPGSFGGDENSGNWYFPTGNVAIGTNVSNGKFRVVDSYSGSTFSKF